MQKKKINTQKQDTSGWTSSLFIVDNSVNTREKKE
jgi:hypothetical protein